MNEKTRMKVADEAHEEFVKTGKPKLLLARLPKGTFDNLPKQNSGRIETWFPSGSHVKYELIVNTNGGLIRAGIRADGYREQSWANVSVWTKEGGWQILFTSPLSDFTEVSAHDWQDKRDRYMPEFQQIAGVLINRAVGLLDGVKKGN